MSKKPTAKQVKEVQSFTEGLLVTTLAVSVITGIALGHALGGVSGAWWGLLLAAGIWTGVPIALDLQKARRAAAAAAEQEEQHEQAAE